MNTYFLVRNSKRSTLAMAISPTNVLVFHSQFLGGMNGQWFHDFLSQARLNLDPNEHAHYNLTIPGPNSELKKRPPYCPFLNIVELAVSALKAAIKADISRPEQQEQMNNRAEARRLGIALSNYRTQLLHQALQRIIGIVVHKSVTSLVMETNLRKGGLVHRVPYTKSREKLQELFRSVCVLFCKYKHSNLF